MGPGTYTGLPTLVSRGSLRRRLEARSGSKADHAERKPLARLQTIFPGTMQGARASARARGIRNEARCAGVGRRGAGGAMMASPEAGRRAAWAVSPDSIHDRAARRGSHPGFEPKDDLSGQLGGPSAAQASRARRDVRLKGPEGFSP